MVELGFVLRFSMAPESVPLTDFAITKFLSKDNVPY